MADRAFEKWWDEVGIEQMPKAGEPPEHASIARLAWDAAQAAKEPITATLQCGNSSECWVRAALAGARLAAEPPQMDDEIGDRDIGFMPVATGRVPDHPPAEKQAEAQEVVSKFPVKWGHEKLVNVLEGAAGLLDVIKGEQVEEWSDWDQSVRNGITRQLLAGAPPTPRCQARHEDGTQCELRGGHEGGPLEGKHLGGANIWELKRCDAVIEEWLAYNFPAYEAGTIRKAVCELLEKLIVARAAQP